MFDQLKKHHIGIVIDPQKMEEVKARYNNYFVYDAIQGTHVMFVHDEMMGLYLEFISREGRVRHHKPGFAHICYSLEDEDKLSKVETFIKENNLGFQITNLEPSPTKECGLVTFYFIKNMGLIELNVEKKNV